MPSLPIRDSTELVFSDILGDIAPTWNGSEPHLHWPRFPSLQIRDDGGSNRENECFTLVNYILPGRTHVFQYIGDHLLIDSEGGHSDSIGPFPAFERIEFSLVPSRPAPSESSRISHIFLRQGGKILVHADGFGMSTGQRGNQHDICTEYSFDPDRVSRVGHGVLTATGMGNTEDTLDEA